MSLALIGGVLGVIGAFFVNLYFPELSGQLIAYRFTVPLLMHTMTSFIVLHALLNITAHPPLQGGYRSVVFTPRYWGWALMGRELW